MMRTSQREGQEIDEALVQLRRGIESREAKLICEASFTVVSRASCAYQFPEVWTNQRIELAKDLLAKVKEATMGTTKESRCASRLDDFTEVLEATLEARESLNKLLATT